MLVIISLSLAFSIVVVLFRYFIHSFSIKNRKLASFPSTSVTQRDDQPKTSFKPEESISEKDLCTVS